MAQRTARGGNPRPRGERGVALPSPVVLLSIAAIVVAGVTFAATGGVGSDPPRVSPVSQPAPGAGAAAGTGAREFTRVPAPTLEKTPPPVDRSEVLVEIYNNSNVTNMAARTAEKARVAGWHVVGVDNWYGTIPAPTVYYPDGMQRAAELLARDLGIARVRQAVEPMRFDRLTVILTAAYA